MKIKKLKSIIKNYTLNSIFTHYMLMLTPLFLIIFFVIAFTITKGINSTEDSRNQTQFDIDSYRIKNTITTIINNIPSYHTTLSAESSKILMHSIPEYDAEISNSLKNFTQLLNNIKNSNPQLASIYVYSQKQDYIYSSNSSICASNYSKHFLHPEIFNEYFKTRNIINFSEKNINAQKHSYMSIVYPIIAESTISLGYVAYNIDIAAISDSITYPIYVLHNDDILYSAHSDEIITAKEIKNLNPDKYIEIEFPDMDSSLFMVNNYKTGNLPVHTYIFLTIVVICLSLAISSIISYSFYYKIDF